MSPLLQLALQLTALPHLPLRHSQPADRAVLALWTLRWAQRASPPWLAVQLPALPSSLEMGMPSMLPGDALMCSMLLLVHRLNP